MSLPPSTNTYQIAGLDDLERGFNRQVEVNYLEGQYQANFRYEKLLLSTDPQVTEAEALLNLVASGAGSIQPSNGASSGSNSKGQGQGQGHNGCDHSAIDISTNVVEMKAVNE